MRQAATLAQPQAAKVRTAAAPGESAGAPMRQAAAPVPMGLADSPNRPKRVRVSSPILAASDEPFRTRVLERLLAAGVDDPQVTDLPGALADLLQDSERPVVVVGGDWSATRPFLRVAVNSGALPVVLLESTALDAEGEALAMGARAALQFDIPVRSLAAALNAVGAGLIVLEPSARGVLQNRQPPSAAPSRRPLTAREREILSLVASGTSNKGIARALDVSANTVKFHLAAVFDKLNAATRAEAVAEAIRRGELSL
jgi:DNA-binding CsgD family transcriptional regulator